MSSVCWWDLIFVGRNGHTHTAFNVHFSRCHSQAQKREKKKKEEKWQNREVKINEASDLFDVIVIIAMSETKIDTWLL